MEKEHIVGAFDADLDRIEKEILAMGKLVKKQIRSATNALLEIKTEEVDSLIANDREINGMNKNNILLNRKILSELAIEDQKVFEKVVKLATN